MHNETRVIVTNKQMRELVPKKINPTRRFTTEKRAIAISIMDNDCDEIDGDLIFGPNPPPLLVCVCRYYARNISSTLRDNSNDSLTARAWGVACHLQVLTTSSHQLIFPP